MEHNEMKQKQESLISTYWPLMAAFGLVACYTLINQLVFGWHLYSAMAAFMGAFFLLFGTVKLVHVRQFAAMFKQYDLIAQLIPGYALAYPLLELLLGLLYISGSYLPVANWVTFIIMSVGAIGVVRALMSKSSISCACLGPYFTIPLTTVTLIENLLMAVMALAMIVW